MAAAMTESARFMHSYRSGEGTERHGDALTTIVNSQAQYRMWL